MIIAAKNKNFDNRFKTIYTCIVFMMIMNLL